MLSIIFAAVSALKAWKNWIVIAAIIAALGLFYLWSWTRGANNVQDRWDAQIAAEREAVMREFVRVARISDRVVVQYIPQYRVIKEQGDVIVKHVKQYVTEKADAECTVPSGFVWLHRESQTGLPVPRDPGASPDAASGITISAVAATDAVNHTRFRLMRLQCQNIIDWYESLRTGAQE